MKRNKEEKNCTMEPAREHSPSNQLTSPRKPHEMTFPDGNGDVTCASGISMKQYEEQLNGLKKENFQLKLRIYFLEEKLGHGAPPAVQGLLENNVRLQVQVAELRRQLADKQQLLADAAHAIDVLEHQGSVSIDSDGSMNGVSTALQQKVEHLEEHVLDGTRPSDTDTQAIPGTDVTTDCLSSTPEQDELLKLKREHHKALQMIQGCMKRIQQQEKQIKKLKITDQSSEPQVNKYQEILKCKDEHIQDLEQKLREAQNSLGLQNNEPIGNLQELLTRRLQGLAYFLDKLLMHKCVLGEDKKRLAESLLEQSLALPVGLQLDESMAPDDLTMDESALDMSQALRIEDLTLMFGHHGLGEDGDKFRRRLGDFVDGVVNRQSESECWSEPDRQVSLARMGLGDVSAGPRASSCEERRRQGRRPRQSADPGLQDEVQRLRVNIAKLEESEAKLTEEVRAANHKIQLLNEEIEGLKSALSEQTAAAENARGDVERARLVIELQVSKRGEAEARANAAEEAAERMRSEKQELQVAFAETERSLRRAADEAALEASRAALERTRAQHERSRVERELQDARDRLSAAAAARVPTPPPPPPTQSDDDRPTSPDQGIDSDRLSSIELADNVSLSPRSLYEENATLKEKLARTKATLADTLAQLNAANIRKMSVQRAICREIHKTHGVLRKARDQFESQS